MAAHRVCQNCGSFIRDHAPMYMQFDAAYCSSECRDLNYARRHVCFADEAGRDSSNGSQGRRPSDSSACNSETVTPRFQGGVGLVKLGRQLISAFVQRWTSPEHHENRHLDDCCSDSEDEFPEMASIPVGGMGMGSRSVSSFHLGPSESSERIELFVLH
mmetsp:Transcript_31853/g.74450  ORF Transcript_31853/g.74450 Transcript_31853/m.74450 type:complete len:159 (-) Transcript_31853:137-613(-)|eukprot:CAMPEP_0178420364 /NCGR_PEP_ID=MMETSP0689_2-20121128/26089_1 /TAXON_ID=160604 /ORGANISM="Amphidinium massartii, Strain CS-259" /LENGTH=158 /DNA_ID=CAMNT_0020041833 /DNA_START=105 /DNA_END=581 /DNA_ORIENTATION=-